MKNTDYFDFLTEAKAGRQKALEHAHRKAQEIANERNRLIMKLEAMFAEADLRMA